MTKRILTKALFCVLAIPGAAAHARQDAPFDRFFTSAATRAELNRARSQYGREPTPSASVRAPEPFELEDVTVNGLILRSDGTGQVWVNRSSDTDRSGPVSSVGLDASDKEQPAVTLTLPGGDRVKLRPGEVFSLETGDVREAYQSAKRPAPEPSPGKEEQSESPGGKPPADAGPAAEFDESRLADPDARTRPRKGRPEKQTEDE